MYLWVVCHLSVLDPVNLLCSGFHSHKNIPAAPISWYMNNLRLAAVSKYSWQSKTQPKYLFFHSAVVLGTLSAYVQSWNHSSDSPEMKNKMYNAAYLACVPIACCIQYTSIVNTQDIHNWLLILFGYHTYNNFINDCILTHAKWKGMGNS